MSACDPIRARATALAALPASDPDRRAAEEHARTCPACAAALRKGASLVQLLDVELRPEPLSRHVLQRAEAAVLREFAAEPAVAVPGLEGLREFIQAALAGAIFVLFVVLARNRTADSRSWLAAGAAASLAAILAAVARRGWPVVGATLGASAVLAVWVGQAGARGGTGFECLGIELLAAALPLGLAALTRGRLGLPATPAGAAGLAATAALAGQASLQVTCGASHSLSHLLAFHVVGVVAAAGLGVGFARLRPRLASSA